MAEYAFCSECNAKLTTDEQYSFDENVLCESCYDNQTVSCTHCGTRLRNDNNAGNYEILLCDNCYDYYYTRCERCGRLITNEEACYAEDDDCHEETFCQTCFDR